MAAVAKAANTVGPALQRRVSADMSPQVLADIYQEDVNLAIWQRRPDTALNQCVANFLSAQPPFRQAVTLTPSGAKPALNVVLGQTSNDLLVDDIAALVARFCAMFDLQQTNLRLSVLDHAMCPKFHVDHVVCRLVTTYLGAGTEWLPHAAVNRSKLGPGSHGQPDNVSGLYSDASDIQQLQGGHVALLKGAGWPDNERAGLVHRSPTPDAGERRLLLTLDFVTE